MPVSDVLRLAMIQMKVGVNKVDNVQRALKFIKEAKAKGSELVILPECFNSPYGTKYFGEYAEEIPNGETCSSLSAAAAESSIYLVAGSIPERSSNKLFNTCTVWSPDGALLAKHQKMHLFDINIPGGITFRESDVLTAGQEFNTFSMGPWNVGLGICYDVRFAEMSLAYRNMGVNFLIYPGAFNMKTGPLHWELLLRGRAVDNQLFVAGVCSARDEKAEYVAWGNSMIVSPWGKVLCSAEAEETLLIQDINLNEVKEIRQQIPLEQQRRVDVYDTVKLKK